MAIINIKESYIKENYVPLNDLKKEKFLIKRRIKMPKNKDIKISYNKILTKSEAEIKIMLG